MNKEVRKNISEKKMTQGALSYKRVNASEPFHGWDRALLSWPHSLFLLDQVRGGGGQTCMWEDVLTEVPFLQKFTLQIGKL